MSNNACTCPNNTPFHDVSCPMHPTNLRNRLCIPEPASETIARITADNDRLTAERDAAVKYSERLRGAINGSGPRDVDYAIALERERDRLTAEVAELRKIGESILTEKDEAVRRADRAEFLLKQWIQPCFCTKNSEQCLLCDTREALGLQLP